ncbi:MAG: type II secretion system protein GspN [Deltaproteobacteria bacterium]|nr:type II secretion system protein GspN [Deltaproteobacteria bacterium]
MMKRIMIPLGCVVLFLLAFWIGIKANFPTDTVTRIISGYTSRLEGFELKFSPVRLGWASIYTETLELIPEQKGKKTPLVSLTNVRVPFSFGLFSGLGVKGDLGEDGQVRVFVPWSGVGTAEFSGKASLKDITLPEELAPMKLDGLVDLNVELELKPTPGKARSIPEGTIEGRLEKLQISGISQNGISLPVTMLEETSLVLKTGRNILVEKLEFNGDMQGQVKGSMTPNLQSPSRSQLRLTASFAPSQGWMGKLGNLRPIVESFLKDGKADVSLEGTLAAPRINQVKK